MNYNDLLEAGRKMPAKQVEDSIRGLAADPRFAAVVVWLDNNRAGFSQAACGQKLASDHGKQSHACGSVHAIVTLEGQLRAVVEPAKATVQMQREEE